jgi:hypothetical protein
VAVGRKLIVAVAPEPSSPSDAVTTPPASETVPWVIPAVTNAAPAGRISVKIAPVAIFGPAFVTTIV